MLGGERREAGPADPASESANRRGTHLHTCTGLPPPLPPGHREMHVIDTDYEQDAILRVSLHWRGRAFHVLKYFSKCHLRGRGGEGALPHPPSPAPCALHSSEP